MTTALVVPASPAAAGGGSSEEDAEIGVGVGDSNATPPGPTGDGPPCWWQGSPASEQVADVYNVIEQITTIIMTVLTFQRHEITVVYYSESNTLHRHNQGSDTYEYKAVRACRAGYTPSETETPIGTTNWFEVADPDPAILLNRTKVVTTSINAPTPEMSPAPDAGAAVNLGLWIAVEEAGPYEAFASLGPRVWARRTATLVGISFDPGNGEVVTCAGRGTPLPASKVDTIEQGPCGYTYTALSDVANDLTARLTARWEVRWELSNGQSGRDPDITTSTSFPYDVYEIQTVGTG